MINNILDKILNKNTLIFIGVSLFVLLFFKQCNQIENLKLEVQYNEDVANRNFNNYRAAQDSIRLERNKNNDLVATARSFELEVNNLTKKNKDLIKKYEEQLNVNRKIEKVNALISADLEVKDSIIDATTIVTRTTDTVRVDISESKNWDKYNWRRFNGSVSIYDGSGSFDVLSTNFNFYQGISLKAALIETEDGDRLRITSPYPNLEFTRIENINIVNDRLNRPTIGKSGWSIGFGIGYGLNLNPDQIISVGPTIGVGLFWSPKWLRF